MIVYLTFWESINDDELADVPAEWVECLTEARQKGTPEHDCYDDIHDPPDWLELCSVIHAHSLGFVAFLILGARMSVIRWWRDYIFHMFTRKTIFPPSTTLTELPTTTTQA